MFHEVKYLQMRRQEILYYLARMYLHVTGNLRFVTWFRFCFLHFGVAVATWIRQSFQNAQRLHWRQIILLIEIVLLFLVGFMPEEQNLIANALVSFSCAMQVQSFRKVASYAFASTMCIGNLRSGMEALCSYQQNHNKQMLYKSFHYFGIIFLFALGAGIGSRFIPILGMHTIWISCLLLLVGFIVMFKQEER